ncbi:short-chain dehydrogenase/reductase SDR [Catenovulum agarivorans DS-2]|uniref:Short-chain dehydrogenase/reductase SDR n=1 Tax=Catenovulum agarivorans DS-2 TaxID=1328313 RepID=W7R3J1_9ALTE|nr:SDR family NAD(P)-dependent oxidoreductase [Catenovulum agarivorans]EWH12190.1 short-chain dehydrogenase/reductase SDR [Catenovulum agarivorans DS-2]
MATKAILITGCSSGIGLHCALELQREGYQVLATARQTQDVDKLIELGLTAHQLDLADPASVEAGFNWAVNQAEDGIYALFNNGAYALPGALEDVTRAQLKCLFETNVFGWHQLTNLCIEHMLEHKQGRIIQNSSVLGLVAMKFRGAYNASKYAIEGLSDTLRLELRHTNIYISLIEPGPILSKFRANALMQFEQNIDVNNSRFAQTYQKMLSRLKKEGPGMAFTEGPESVLKRVRHALNAKQPQARYYVTKPTYFIGLMRRILPTKWLDQLVKNF